MPFGPELKAHHSPATLSDLGFCPHLLPLGGGCMLWRRPSRVCRAGAACIAARAVRAAAIGAIGLSGLVQALRNADH